jgi:hypothetical protein
MPLGGDKVPHNVQELRGKVLVNEQELQSAVLRLIASLNATEHPVTATAVDEMLRA